ncbi:SGNH/GDSL hydrolase family protein [Comamonas guangdongensis]|uniref:SGNH/GDSL hydrolase family protein n=1 Tax=Comamonas guangdongensis TaxID=510515 RepID=A0ABV3ZZT8_9BURK
MKSALSLGLFSLLAIAAPIVHSEIYTLGDSLSDAGSLGITYTDPSGVNPLVSGKTWIQDLTSSTPAFCDDRKQCPWDPRTYYYRDGNNYAVGGAGVMFDSTDSHTPNTFTSLGSQISALINSGKLKGGDAITILMGSNDVLAAATKPGSSQAVVNAATSFVHYVSVLAAQPSHPHIYVFTLPDLGQSPFGRSTADSGASLSQLAQIFNSEITAGLRNTSGVKFVISSTIFGELSQQLLNYPIYCTKVIDTAHACGSTANPVLQGPVNLLFADPLHPSRVAHAMIADRVRNVIK